MSIILGTELGSRSMDDIEKLEEVLRGDGYNIPPSVIESLLNKTYSKRTEQEYPDLVRLFDPTKLQVKIVCGFDMVGKTPLIHQLDRESCKSGNKTVSYRCDYTAIDDLAGRNSSWIAGFYTLDLLTKLPTDTNLTVVYDRGLPCSWVYSELYNNPISNDIVNSVLNKLDLLDVEIHYMTHSNRESAKLIYNSREKVEEYDVYPDFDKYWDTYLKVDKLYRSFFTEHMSKTPVFTYQSSVVPGTNGSSCTIALIEEGVGVK